MDKLLAKPIFNCFGHMRSIDWIEINFQMTNADTLLFFSLIAIYNNIPLKEARKIFELDEKEFLVPGGPVFKKGKTKIYPPKSSKLQDWRSILKAIKNKREVWQGLTDAPQFEYKNDKIIIWEKNSENKEKLKFIKCSYKEIFEAFLDFENELTAFIEIAVLNHFEISNIPNKTRAMNFMKKMLKLEKTAKDYDLPYTDMPYCDNVAELKSQLFYLITSDDSFEKVESVIYNEIIPNIKGHSKIYNGIFQIIDFFSFYLENELIEYTFITQKCKFIKFNNENKDQEKKQLILLLLGNVFMKQICDEMGILLHPLSYNDKSLKRLNICLEEIRAFYKFKWFYLNYFSGDSYREVIPYDCLFYEAVPAQDLLLEILNKENYFDVGIGLGYLRYKYPQLSIPADQLNKIDEKYKDVVLAMNGLPYIEEEVLNAIKSFEKISSIWAMGSVAVIASDAYMISVLQKSENEQKRVILNILISYDFLRKNYTNNSHDFKFPIHQILLEDLISIIFREHIGKSKKTEFDDLTPIQKFIFIELSENYKTHTFSMLNAGLLPKGVSEKQLGKISDIYKCYD